MEAPEIVSSDIVDILKSINTMIIANDYLEAEKGEFIKEARGKHGLQISELLLLYFQSHFSKIVGKNLVPTYSYTRIYGKGSDLPRHSDRPSCQYSMTINIGGSSDDPWPFFCKSKIKDVPTSKIINSMYVPIIYMGMKVSHWRETLEKDYSTHIFLHYVDGDDVEYNQYWYDKRKFIGI
jgi:hypothetical protein